MAEDLARWPINSPSRADPEEDSLRLLLGICGILVTLGPPTFSSLPVLRAHSGVAKGTEEANSLAPYHALHCHLGLAGMGWIQHSGLVPIFPPRAQKKII
jgi:hypothetical protein